MGPDPADVKKKLEALSGRELAVTQPVTVRAALGLTRSQLPQRTLQAIRSFELVTAQRHRVWERSMGTSKVDVEARRWAPADEPARAYSEIGFPHSFHYWRGASGDRYLHMVYSLIGCPTLPKVNYILVRRYDDGRRVALVFGQTKEDAVSLNLARLRHEGAKRGANEVHIHLLADTPEARDAVEADLRRAAIAA